MFGSKASENLLTNQTTQNLAEDQISMPSIEEDIEDYDDRDIMIEDDLFGMTIGKIVKPQVPAVKDIDSSEEELNIEFDLQDKVIEVEGKRRLMTK